MTDRLHFGFVSPSTAEGVREAEAMPIDSLWVGGHVSSPNPTPEAMVQLARLSAVSTRVRIGTSILLLPLYQPAIVAKQIADIDRAVGGRVTLGVGVGGEYESDFKAAGVPVNERGPRTNEAIPLIRRLWTAEPVTHHGRFYSFDDLRIHPAPAQGTAVPIVVSGRQPPAMRRAASMGDGWMPYMYSPGRYAKSVAAIKEHADTIGRDLSSGFEWFAWVFINVDEDSMKAKEACAAAMGGNYRQDFTAMVDGVAAAGSKAEVIDKLGKYVEAGVRHFIFAPATREGLGGNRRIFELLMSDVVPQLTV